MTIAVEGVGDAEYDEIRDSLVEVGARLRRLGPHRRRLTEILQGQPLVSTSEGQVFDLGYLNYVGTREGRARARKALFVNGIRTCFGLGRGAMAKVLPILFFLAVMAPAAVFSVMAGLFGDILVDLVDLLGHEDYYTFVSVILFIFAAIIAPELLCTDRRSGVINLYLVRPLTSNDYVLGRWSAFFLVSVLFIYSGQVLLLLGLTLGAPDPLQYLRENWLDIPKFLGAGLAIAVITTTVPLAAASLTDRRAYATVAVIGLFLISSITVGALQGTACEWETESSGRSGQSSSGTSVEVTFGSGGIGPNEDCRLVLGDAARWAQLLDIGNVQTHVSDMVFGVYDDAEDDVIRAFRLPMAVAVAWYFVVAAVAGFIIWNRYRRLAT